MKSNRGLSIIEVLVVVVLIALAIAILLPAVQSRCGPSPRIAVCAANLRHQVKLFTILSVENGGKPPVLSGPLASLCDQSIALRDAMMDAGTRQGNSVSARSFYCPANSGQNQSSLWQHDGISTWGYVWLNPRDAAPALPAAFPLRDPSLDYRTKIDGPGAARAELALDVVVSDTVSGPISWSPKSPPVAFGTNHLATTTPRGANVAFLDGHVEWRTFNQAKATAIPTGPQWLWIPQP